LIVPLALLALPAAAIADAPLQTNSWWEKVTVRMNGSGEAQGCQYQSSRATRGGADCKVVGASGLAKQASANDGAYAITFERRFDLGETPPGEAVMQTGDKLLGSQVMALVIDAAGKVSGCEVVNSTGETGLSYGCTDAAQEHFAASGEPATARDRHGFMTILVYGHSEHVV
jgi:hypothetical protein